MKIKKVKIMKKKNRTFKLNMLHLKTILKMRNQNKFKRISLLSKRGPNQKLHQRKKIKQYQ